MATTVAHAQEGTSAQKPEIVANSGDEQKEISSMKAELLDAFKVELESLRNEARQERDIHRNEEILEDREATGESVEYLSVLQKELRSARDEVAAISLLKDELSKTVDMQNEKIIELKAQEGLEASEIKSMEKIIESSRNHNSALQSEIELFKKRAGNDERKISELNKKLEEYQQEAKGQLESKMEHNEQLKSAEQKISDLEAQVKGFQSLEAQLEASLASNRELSLENENLREGEETIDYSKKIFDLKRTINDQYKRMENMVDATEILVGQKKIRELEDKVKEMKMYPSMLESSRAANMTLLKEGERLKKQIDTEKRQVSALKKAIEEKEKSFIAQEAEKSLVDVELKKCQEVIKELQRKSESLKGFEALNIQLKSDFEASQATNLALMSEITKFEKELKIAKAEIPKIGKRFEENVKEERLAFAQERKNFENELMDAKEIIADKEAEIKSYEMTMEQEIERARNMATEQAKLFSKQFEKLDVDDHNEYMRLASIGMEDGDLTESNEKAVTGKSSAKIATLNAEIRTLKAELEQMQIEMNKNPSAEAEMKNLQEKLQEKEAMHEEYKREMDIRLNEAQKEVQGSALELDRLREMIRNESTSSDETKAMIEEKLKESQEEKHQLEELLEKGKQEDDRAQIIADMDALNVEMVILREQLVAKDKQVDLAQNELVAMREEMRNLRVASEINKNEQVPETSAYENGSKEEGGSLDDEYLKKLKDQRAIFDKIRTGIEKKLKSSQKALLEKEKEVEEMKTELESLRADVKEYRRLISGSSASDFYKNKLKETEKELASLQDEVAKYRAVWMD
mmetsp:Transcript_32873/g.49602  ORF Transcript_32873/g.49602 Transcript_32873/m.49602 type:complete len:808 (+) Transcript_32873:35-2458(+)